MNKALNSNYLVAGVLLIAGAVAWINPNTFLWRDDWLYLLFYEENSYQLFRGHIASDIKPLFQYLLFLEFHLFKDTFFYFQLVNVFILVGCSVVLFRILLAFEIRRGYALAGSLLMLLHPTNFVNVLWIFQQCELIHLLLFLLCILAFRKYSITNRQEWLLLYALSLLVQNYFFPNGVFYPLMFIFLEILNRGLRRVDYHIVLISLLLFAINIVHAIYIQGLMRDEALATTSLFSHLPEKAAFFIYLISSSFGRLLIPNLKSPIFVWLVFCPLLIGMMLFIATRHKTPHRPLLWVGAGGLVFSSIVLTLTRYTNSVIPYYYTSLHIPFFLMVIGPTLQTITETRFKNRIGPFILGGLLVVFVFFDFKGRKLFSLRNRLNHLQMEEAAAKGNSYQPVDDPAIEIPGYISIDGLDSKSTAVKLYKQLKAGMP